MKSIKDKVGKIVLSLTMVFTMAFSIVPINANDSELNVVDVVEKEEIEESYETTKEEDLEKLVGLFKSLPMIDGIHEDLKDEEKQNIFFKIEVAMNAFDQSSEWVKAQFQENYSELFTSSNKLKAMCMNALTYTINNKQLVGKRTNKTAPNIQVSTYDELNEAIKNAPSNSAAPYIIEVIADFDIAKKVYIEGKNIIIRGDNPKRTLTRGNANIYCFDITTNASVIFENIIIDGAKDTYPTNTEPLIISRGNGKLELKDGTVIQNASVVGNLAAIYLGGSADSFEMSGTKIINCTGNRAGAIFISNATKITNIQIVNSEFLNNTTINGSGGVITRDGKNPYNFVLTLDNSKMNGNKAGGYGGAIFIGQNATINMKNGSQMNDNISGTGAGNTYYAGAIYAGDNFTLNMESASQINRNISSKGDGGAIYSTNNSTFNITGGSQINGNKAKGKGYGGGIYNLNSINSFLLVDSEMCDNTAVNGGGAIQALSGFPLTVSGNSKINDNTAGGFGGGIAVVSKPFPTNTKVIFEGTTELVGNNAANGGAFWLGNSGDFSNPFTLDIKDQVKIQNNTAKDTGGIYVRGANVTISSTIPISNNANTTKNGSSAINLAYGTLTLKNGAKVENNNAGTPVSVTNESTLTMESGSSISNNTSKYSGGGARLNYGCFLEMKQGSIISNNTVTDGGGGGIYLYASSARIAGEVSNNESVNDSGGGIYIHGFTKAYQTKGTPEIYIVNGAEIKNNVAAKTGGGIYVNGPKTNEDIDPRAVLYVEGGQITGNTANGKGNWVGIDYGGGGVAVDRGQAIISGGSITGNTAIKGGGGVQANAQNVIFGGGPFIGSGRLKLTGGNISDNISGGITDRTAMGIQGVNSAEITIADTFINKQSLKVDTKSKLFVDANAAFSTIGNVTIGNTTVDPNGGTVSRMKNFIENGNIIMPPESIKDTFDFGGWYDGTDIFNVNDSNPISGSKTYKAVWKNLITYKPGTKAEIGQDNKEQLKYTDINIKLLDATYNRKGYIQSGWTTSENGIKQYELEGNYTQDKALILYPAWEAIDYTITFDSKGGSDVASTIANYQQLLTEPKNPAKEGYTFLGWFNDSALKKAWDFTSDKVVGDMTLYAKWKKGISYECGGDITGTTEKPTAYLIRDGKTYDAVVTGKSSLYHYLIRGVPEGTYNLVVSAGKGNATVTTTILVNIVNQSINRNVKLPQNEYNSKVVVVGDETPNIEGGGLDDIAQTIGDSLPSANRVDIELKVKANEKSINSKEVLLEIFNDPNFMVNGIILDLDLIKKINNQSSERILELSKTEHGVDLITVVFHLPEELKGKDKYALYRYHNDTVDKITETVNQYGEKIIVSEDKTTIYASIKKFSTYAIAYSDPSTLVVENGEGSGTYKNMSEIEISANQPKENTIFKEWQLISGKGDFKDRTKANTTFTIKDKDVVIKAIYQEKNAPVQPEEDKESPSTGDTNVLGQYMVMFLFSSIIGIFLLIKRKKRFIS
ncbi:MAG: InlB B-repeat-containing protein [Erysipelotrichaceae bacterium]